MRTSTLAILASAWLLAQPGAEAAVIKIEASGVIATAPLLVEGFGDTGRFNGTKWSMTAFVDFDAADTSVFPFVGIYGPLSGTFTFGAESVLLDSYPEQFRSVSIADAGGVSTRPHDVATIGANDFLGQSVAEIGGQRILGIAFRLRTAGTEGQTSLFGSTSLPEILGLDLAALGSCLSPAGYCDYSSRGPAFNMAIDLPDTESGLPPLARTALHGTVETFSATVIPLPGALWFLLTGLGMLAYRSPRA
jgi:hypothetical protein